MCVCACVCACHFYGRHVSFICVCDSFIQSVMLQHAATRCNMLQHTATCCNKLQHAATHSSTMMHSRAATHCNTLHQSAPHCNIPVRTAVNSGIEEVVHSFFKRRQHENTFFHFGHAKSRDSENFTLSCICLLRQNAGLFCLYIHLFCLYIHLVCQKGQASFRM